MVKSCTIEYDFYYYAGKQYGWLSSKKYFTVEKEKIKS